MIYDKEHIYFLGIGGIGMSALARYYKNIGKQVYGYDKVRSEICEALESEGINICYQDNTDLIPQEIDAVVYTPAIPASNNQFVALKEREVVMVKRAAALGELSRKYKTVAVAGTHGKTTTSCLMAHVLHAAGLKEVALLGGLSLDFNSNFYMDNDAEWLVTEADEFDRSFLHLNPFIGVVTSIEPDHLEVYGTEEKVIAGFKEFVNKIDDDGYLVCHRSIVDHLRGLHKNIITYSFDQGNSTIENSRRQEGMIHFDVDLNGKVVSGFQFRYPGRYNKENALATITVANIIGIEEEKIRQGIRSFRGVYRRFEYLCNDPVVIDDYAHHPSELEAFIQAVREMFGDSRILGVFQPHLYSRTKDQANGFARSLSLLDQVVLLPIYPAREEPIEGITSKWLLDKIDIRAKAVVEKKNLTGYLEDQEFDVLLLMGAGDIDQLRKPIQQMFKD